jgi:hypothetical protein
MKVFIYLFVLLLSTSVFADMEHIEGQGQAPSKQRMKFSRACFAEMEELSCGHPREDQEFFTSCLDEKHDSLSLNCQSFFERLYGKRK